MTKKKQNTTTNHKMLDERSAPIISSSGSESEEVRMSPDKEAMLNSLLPSDTDRDVARLNMNTERMAPLPDLGEIPDVVSSEDISEAALAAELQDMASGEGDLLDLVVLPDDDLDAGEEKQTLIDALMPGREQGAAVTAVTPIEEPVVTGNKQAMFESLNASADSVVDSSVVALDQLETTPEMEPVPQVVQTPEPVVTQDKVFSDDATTQGVLGGAASFLGNLPAREFFEVPIKEIKSEVIAGLTLWDDCATVCLLKVRHGKLEVSHAGQVDFSDKADDAERVELIRAMWKRASIPTRSVWVSVHSSSFVQKYATYDLPDDELSSAVLRDAEQSLQSMGGDVAVEWSLNPRALGGVEGMVFAIPRWERDHYIDLLRQAGLYVCGMSSAACDLARTLEMSRPYPDLKQRPAECVVSFSQTGADIVIVYGSGNIYSRTVYSRVANWHDNMNYLYECLNDAIGYFSGWITDQSVSTLLLTGLVPEVSDIGGELLRETGIFAEVWNPVQECELVEMSQLAKNSGVSGTIIGGSLGLAVLRG